VLEDKTKNHKQAKNTQFHVSVARHNIDEVNSELDDLVESLEHLRYYKTVLEDAFDGTAPTMVNSAIQAAEKVVETTQADLLENVQSGEVGDGEIDLASNDDTRNPEVQLTSEINKQIEQIQSVKRQVDNVTETIKRQLESKRDEWSEKVGAAEELQKILGSQNEDFSRTLSHMHQLLTNDLMNSSGTGVRFVSKWTAAVGNWVEHQSLQSFDDFQRRHDLLDSTVTDVKALSRSKQLTLADVSIASLEEMKRVDEMESAVELSL
jgi:hypothetical protein